MDDVGLSGLIVRWRTQNSSEKVNIMGRTMTKARDGMYYFSEWFIHILLVFLLNKVKSYFY